MPRSLGYARGGFTLVEVLVAMTVASVGLVAIFTGLRMAGSTADLVRDQQQAQQLAQLHMTSLLADSIKQMGTQSGQAGRFGWEEAIHRTKDPELAEVVVTVRWLQQGRAMTFQLVSLRAIGAPAGGSA